MEKDAVIYVAGHTGLAGSAIVRKLRADGHSNIVTRSHKELDLIRQKDTERFLNEVRPDYVFMAAAKVGSIMANDTYPADFIYRNLAIQTNMIEAARQTGVRRLLFLGSSCIYPRECPQPMKEDNLLTGPLEKTNEAYAVAKIAGIKMCQAYNKQYQTRFVSVMPTNLYGPCDNFDPEFSHVPAALLRKFHEAKVSRGSEVVVWGTGRPRREFLHADDLADACCFIMNLDQERFDSLFFDHETPLVNIGVGRDISIAELAELVKEIVGYQGDIVYDTAKPDGTFQKLQDVSRLSALGWQATIPLQDGLRQAYQWCLDNQVF
ncbi:MAG: GDP-L-fucose synthase family protein [Desulfosudaceae bacterium]